jgi:hypothetical protein
MSNLGEKELALVPSEETASLENESISCFWQEERAAAITKAARLNSLKRFNISNKIKGLVYE